jgi:hypothetical protein
VRLLSWIRRHLAIVAGLTALVAAALVTLVFLGPIGPAPVRCENLTDPGCGRYLQIILSGIDDEVDAIRAVPWCGEDECQQLFGADTARFVVTYEAGNDQAFSCWTTAGDLPRCQLADP